MPRALILYLWFWVCKGFQSGPTAPIQAQEEVWAAAGGDAELSCQLLEDKEVHQVTWQKSVEGQKVNIGSYSEYFNTTVNPGFLHKVEFKEAGLQNNSIVLKKVTEQDGGCYFCRFSTFPEGILERRTCLHVYELHGPVLHIRELWSPEGSGVSCSATGRPVPTVTLTVKQQHLSFSQHNTTRVHNNNNNTVTVTTTAVLSGLHGNSTQVGCVVGVASGAQVQVFQSIPERKGTSDNGSDERSESDQRHRWIFIIIGGADVLVVCALAAVFIWKRNLRTGAAF